MSLCRTPHDHRCESQSIKTGAMPNSLCPDPESQIWVPPGNSIAADGCTFGDPLCLHFRLQTSTSSPPEYHNP
ncbi:unnamed protein product [Linum tenue]|uniref:Uncharacterized protein n=1 Tax=Linum tenue TaxID=586396 RepID=A0AAV0NCM9_9ROSI|nr:unnamed protein product [Linum tenue]